MTMKTTHTPGPWTFDATDWPIIINPTEEGDSVFPNSIAVIHCREESEGEWDYPEARAIANAFLVSTAPDLLRDLDALHALIAVAAPQLMNTDCFNRAGCTIARARGETA